VEHNPSLTLLLDSHLLGFQLAEARGKPIQTGHRRRKLCKKEFPKCQNALWGWALVAHACNPSYSGGRDQEDCGRKPVLLQNVFVLFVFEIGS
jgi:hypothetical protein